MEGVDDFERLENPISLTRLSNETERRTISQISQDAIYFTRLKFRFFDRYVRDEQIECESIAMPMSSHNPPLPLIDGSVYLTHLTHSHKLRVFCAIECFIPAVNVACLLLQGSSELLDDWMDVNGSSESLLSLALSLGEWIRLGSQPSVRWLASSCFFHSQSRYNLNSTLSLTMVPDLLPQGDLSIRFSSRCTISCTAHSAGSQRPTMIPISLNKRCSRVRGLCCCDGISTRPVYASVVIWCMEALPSSVPCLVAYVGSINRECR